MTILNGVPGVDAGQTRVMLERSLLRTQALRTMVQELLSLTAMEAGKLVIKRAPLDLVNVVEAVLESNKEKADAKEQELSLVCEGSVAGERVLADKDTTKVVLGNLVDNAIKYTPEKGHIHVVVEHDGIYVKVTVRDDGIGMTPEEKVRAFDEFYRAKNEKTAGIPGTGLGLTLVKRLVEIHQGRVKLRTAPGEGCEFTVSLPTAE